MALVDVTTKLGIPVASYYDAAPPKAGEVIAWAGTSVPTGWLACDGSEQNQTTYPDLFANIGSTYATQINPTTGAAWAAPTSGFFRLPDYRGVFLRGVGSPVGQGAVALGAHQTQSTALNGVSVAGGTSALTGTTSFASTAHTHAAGSIVAHISIGGTGITEERVASGSWSGTHQISSTVTATSSPGQNTGAGTDGTTGGPSANGTVGLSNTPASISSTDTETRPVNKGVQYIIRAFNAQAVTYGGGSSGGLSPLEISTSPASAVNNTMYEIDLTTATVTIPFPTGTGAATIGVLDALRLASDVKFIRVTPPTGQRFDGFPVNDSITITNAGGWAFLYRAAGSTTIRGQYPVVSAVSPGFQPGYTGSSAISAGMIGEVVTATDSTSRNFGSTAAAAWSSVNNLSINLSSGEWLISFSVTAQTASFSATGEAYSLARVRNTTDSTTHMQTAGSYVTIVGTTATPSALVQGHSGSKPILITGTKTFTVDVAWSSNSGSPGPATQLARNDWATAHLTATRIA